MSERVAIRATVSGQGNENHTKVDASMSERVAIRATVISIIHLCHGIVTSACVFNNVGLHDLIQSGFA